MKKAVVFALFFMILGMIFAGSLAHADSQCWDPYVYVAGQSYTEHVCIPCVNNVCPFVAPPVPRHHTGIATVGVVWSTS